MESTTNDNIEDKIRRRAYELWEQYGRPEGGEEEFWLRAERELTGEMDGNSLGGPNVRGAKSGSGSDGPR